MITKIQKIGNDLGIDIPKGLLEQLGWSDREEVSVVSVDGKLIIERSKNVKRKNIFELFEGFSGEYKPETIGWGESVGSETQGFLNSITGQKY